MDDKMGTAMAKEMYSMRKIAWLFIGYVVAGLMYFALRYFLSALPHPGYGGESIWGLLFFVVIPISIYLGSIITGYNLSKTGDSILANSIIYNPGLLFSVTYFINTINFPVFIKGNQIQAFIELFMYLMLYMTVSVTGIYTGYRIHGGKSKKASS